MNLGVASIDWREGDEVISATTEHPGCLVPLHNLRKRFGVRGQARLASRNAREDRKLPSRRRRASSPSPTWTGRTARCCRYRRSAPWPASEDVLTLVDGAQSVGNIEVDVPSTGADMYAFTGHKWVLGPEGMGAFYVRPDLPVHSPNVGFMSLPAPTDFDAERGLRTQTRRPSLRGLDDEPLPRGRFRRRRESRARARE